jgi:hypothetical protein
MQAAYTAAVYQTSWDSTHQLCGALAQVSPSGKEHLIAFQSCTGNPVANGFITAVGGSKSRTTRLNNQQFTTQAQVRLCANTMRAPAALGGTCKHCHSVHGSVRTSDHALRCKGIGKYPRHQAVMAALVTFIGSNRALLPADFRCSSETRMDRLPYPLQPNKAVPQSTRAGKQGPKVADAAITIEGATYVVDAVITHPKRETQQATAAGGATAAIGYDYKVKFYTDHLVFAENQKKYLWPLAFDSHGHLDQRSINHLKTLVAWIAGNDKVLYSMKLRQLYEALSAAVARGNTAMVSSYYLQHYPIADNPVVGAGAEQ